MKYLIINICISGFTQDRGYYHGILKLREELIKAGHADGYANRVWYLPWTTEWELIAADLSIICVQHGLIPIVQVSGYSYGGFGAINLCAALEQKGVEVRVINLCDPVGRRWWWPRPLPALTSMLSRDMAFTLRVPDNVRLVNEWWQTNNRPQGHRLRLGPHTKRGAYGTLPYRHQEMDDAPEFHERVLWHAAEIVNEVKSKREALCGDQL